MTREPPPPVVLVFVLLLAAPVLLWSRFAQDAVPFVVAGELARDGSDDIYVDSGDLYDLSDRFAERSCEVSPAGTDCAENVAFVSPPPAIPLAVLVSAAGDHGGVFLLRCVAAASIVAGLALLRRRVLARHPDADRWVLLGTLVLLPMAMVPIALGQTSPLLFLSAALGLAVARRSGAHGVAVGALWGATVAIKLSPIFLLPVLVRRRHWTVLAAGLGVVGVGAVAALPFGGLGRVDSFRNSLSSLDEGVGSNVYNGGLDGVVHRLGLDPGSTAETAILWGVRGVLLVALVLVGRRIVDEDVQWAWAWTGCLLFVPLVWWHYLWVALAALVLALLARPVDRRPWWVVGAFVAASVPISLVNGTEDAVPDAQFVFLIASVALASIWARKARPEGLRAPVG